ncbi:UNVERIFIED_CONTAM: glyoxylase-like metal-dependent hydrolase (beta-lactamase superfamily II) [Acetivibrio alkalicellulosi]
MVLECLDTGMFNSNCYILGNNGEGVIIDSGVEPDEIISVLDKNKLIVKFILLTHGHIDHICFVDKLRDKTGAKVLIHENDSKKLIDSVSNGSIFFGLNSSFEKADGFLKDGDEIEVGGIKLEIIHTPGHSSGSICIKVGDKIFTGDTLFKMGRGRTDLSDGNEMEIFASIKNKLLVLEDKTLVFPGHGDETTIGAERVFY